MSKSRSNVWKLRDIVDLKDPAFGAKGDGATNDQAAVAAWLLACAGVMGFAPAGTYMVDSITPSANTVIQGAGQSVTIFKARSNNDAPVIDLGNNSDITLKDFAVNGNSAVKAGGPGNASGITLTNGNRIRCENVVVTDCQDWGFWFAQGSDIRLRGCAVTNLKGGVNANAVRGGYLLGNSSGGTSVNDVVMTACTASGAGANLYYDGFLSEKGSDHRFVGCQAAVPYTGFKLKGDRVSAIGCYATGCTAGFQTQTSSQGMLISGCTAYRNLGSGFQFNQLDGATPARNWVVTGNLSIENGQDAGSSTRYGYAFELAGGTTLDVLVFTGNVAADNQGVATQVRGVSFSNNGTISHATVVGNTAKGHANDFNYGTCLQTATATLGPNDFLTGSAAFACAAPTAHRLNFWTDNIPAGAGVTSLNDGLSGRGYVMPRAGYVKSQCSKSNAAVTAGSVTFQPRKNNANFTSNVTHDAAAGTFAQRDETPQTQTFAAGDVITCVFTSTAGLLPAGTDDFDVVVEVVYT